MKKTIVSLINETSSTILSLGQECAGTVEAIVNAVTESLNQGGKVLIFGNGGSAADSQHMAAELVGRFKKERNGLAAIALTANTSTISALANDYGYDRVFERQIEALGRKGDLAIGISTSGKSKSIITALIKAKSLGLKTVAMTGAQGTNLNAIADICLCVPSNNTPRIQEAHITCIHIICQLVEDNLGS